MPRATDNRSTSTPTSPTPASTVLTITALGEQAANVRRQGTSKPGETFGRTLFYREAALNALMATMPAVTLADAAHQLTAGYMFVDTLHACDITPPETQAFVEDRIRDLYRVVLSVLPIVIDAARLTPDDLGIDYLPQFHANCFAAKVVA